MAAGPWPPPTPTRRRRGAPHRAAGRPVRRRSPRHTGGSPRSGTAAPSACGSAVAEADERRWLARGRVRRRLLRTGHGRNQERYRWAAARPSSACPRARSPGSGWRPRGEDGPARRRRRPVEPEVGPEPAWVEIALEGAAPDVLNSAGVGAGSTAATAPTAGYLQADDGRYDERDEVFAWSGGAVCCPRGLSPRGGPLRRALLHVLRGLRPGLARPASGAGGTCTCPVAAVRHSTRHSSVDGFALVRPLRRAQSPRGNGPRTPGGGSPSAPLCGSC